jgi:hypothetical protein
LGPLEALKKKYHCELLTMLIEAADDGNGMPNKIRKVNLQDVIFIGSHNHGKRLNHKLWQDYKESYFHKMKIYKKW